MFERTRFHLLDLELPTRVMVCILSRCDVLGSDVLCCVIR
jgi:hypothetical protein